MTALVFPYLQESPSLGNSQKGRWAQGDLGPLLGASHLDFEPKLRGFAHRELVPERLLSFLS